MSGTLTDSVQSVFTEPLLSKFSGLLGETGSELQKAVHGAIPMVLTAILNEAYFPEGIIKVRELSRQAATSDFFGQLHELSTAAGGLVAGSLLLNKGTDFSRNLLAARTDLVIGEISRYAGISVPSASFITGIASFAALDAVGRYTINSNADAAGLATWLKMQDDPILHTIPAGLQVKQALGLHHYPWERKVKVRRNRSPYVIGTIVILALLLFLLYRSCQHTEDKTSPAVTDTPLKAPATTLSDTAASIR